MNIAYVARLNLLLSMAIALRIRSLLLVQSSVLIPDLRFLFMFDVLMRTKRECRKDNILI